MHCANIKNPAGDDKYIYHISDDTNHDAILTFEVISDILLKHPYLMKDGYLVVRSDNCEDQHKCRYTFYQMRELAIKLKIDIFWFYGAPGHGRGIIDAMSSFGCKKPLRRSIIAEDNWFADAQSMIQYLTHYFKDDTSKEHYIIDEEKTASKRREEKKGLKIRPCRAYHLIALSSEGDVHKQLFYKGDPLKTIFEKDDAEEFYDEINDFI